MSRQKKTPAADEAAQAALSPTAVADEATVQHADLAPASAPLIATDAPPVELTMASEPDPHMKILQALLEPKPATPRREPTATGQQPRRRLQQLVRQRAVQLADEHLLRGGSLRETAQALAIAERTLRHWYRSSGLATLLGRPRAVVTADQQQMVLHSIQTIGPGVGVPTLRAHFTDLSRATLDALVKGYRDDWRAANPRLLHVLHWLRPGSVWAMDFAQAPCLIDGCYEYVLAVRDLASGLQLLWQPVAAPTADVVRAELQLLFMLHGAPWLVKTDNGSAFIADTLRWYFHRNGVGQLFSPPCTPAYNGAIEASIGSLKTRTHAHSDRAGHVGVWTSADLAAALAEANTQSRPRRLHGQTPAQVWQARAPLGADEHARFRATVAQFQSEERALRGWSEHQPLTRTEQASLDRVAFRRALVAHDLLLFRRRRILPQIPRRKTATKG